MMVSALPQSGIDDYLGVSGESYIRKTKQARLLLVENIILTELENIVNFANNVSKRRKYLESEPSRDAGSEPSSPTRLAEIPSL